MCTKVCLLYFLGCILWIATTWVSLLKTKSDEIETLLKTLYDKRSQYTTIDKS